MEPKYVQYRGEKTSTERKAIIEFIDNLVPEVKRKDVIDIGTGSWFYPQQTLGKEAHSFTTNDIRKMSDKINIICDVLDLPEKVGRNKFDVAICVECFEHIKYPWKAASAIHEVLKPGGLVALSVPIKK